MQSLQPLDRSEGTDRSSRSAMEAGASPGGCTEPTADYGSPVNPDDVDVKAVALRETQGKFGARSSIGTDIGTSASVAQLDINKTAKRPGWEKWRPRFSRRKWLLVGGGCATLLLTFLLILFLAILPAVVQRAVDRSSLGKPTVIIREPTDSGFLLDIHTAVASDSPFTAKIHAMSLEAFAEADSLDSSMPVGRLELPGFESGGGEVALAGRFLIADVARFEAFAKLLLQRRGGAQSGPVAKWRLVGQTTVTAAGLDFPNIKFEKSLDFDGLSQLAAGGVDMREFSLSASPDGSQVAVAVTVALKSAGRVGIADLGDLSFAMRYDDLDLGPIVARNAQLLPGDNVLRLQGWLEPRAKDEATKKAKLDELLSLYLGGKRPIVTVSGRGSTISIFNAAVSELSLPAALRAPQGKVVRGFKFERFALEPVPGAEATRATLSGRVSLQVGSPLGPTAPIDLLKASLAGTLRSGSVDGAVLGVLDGTLLPPNGTERAVGVLLPANETAEGAGAVFAYSLDLVADLALADGGAPFGEFVASFLSQPAVSVFVSDSAASVDADTKALGPISIGGLTVDQRADLKTPKPDGTPAAPAVRLQQFNVTGVAPDGSWLLRAKVDVTNPTSGTLNLGQPLRVRLAYKDTAIGELATTERVALQAGSNPLVFEGSIPPPSDPAALSEFFSQYVSGGPTTLQVTSLAGNTADETNTAEQGGTATDTSGATVAPWLQKAVGNLAFNTTLTGGQQSNGPLLESVDLQHMQLALSESTEGTSTTVTDTPAPVDAADSDAVPLRGTLQLQVNNPLGGAVPLNITQVGLEARLMTPDGQLIGDLTAPMTDAVQSRRLQARGVRLLQTLGQQDWSRLAVQVPLDARLLPSVGEEGGDGGGFGAFVGAFFANDTVEVLLEGQARVGLATSLGDLSLNSVPLRRTLTLQGLRGLRGSRVESLSLGGLVTLQGVGQPVDALGLTLSVRIANPSATALRLGALSVALRYNGVTIGRVSPPEEGGLALLPGNDSIALQGGLSGLLDADGAGASALSTFFSEALAGRQPQLETKLEEAPGQQTKRPAWMKSALRGVKFSPEIPPLKQVIVDQEGTTDGVGALLRGGGLVKSVKLQSATVAPLEDSSAVGFSISLDAAASNPFGSGVSLAVSQLGLSANLLFPSATLGRNVTIGRLVMPSAAATSEPQGDATAAQTLQVLAALQGQLEFADDGTAFGDFVSAVSKAGKEGVRLFLANGTIAAGLDTPFGSLALEGLPLGGYSVALGGLGDALTKEGGMSFGTLSFLGPAKQTNQRAADLVTAVGLPLGGGLAISASLGLRVPGSTGVELGNVALRLLVNGTDQEEELGRVVLQGLTLRKGPVTVPVVGLLGPLQGAAAEAAASAVLSKYIAGGNVTVRAVGAPSDDQAVWVQRLVSSLDMQVQLPKLKSLGSGGPLGSVALSGLAVEAVDDRRVGLSGSISAVVKSPFGDSEEDGTLEVLQVAVDAQLSRETDLGAQTLGTLKTSWMDAVVSGEVEGGVAIGMASQFLTFPDKGAAFGRLAVALLRSKSNTTLSLSGTAKAVVATDIGRLTLDGLRLDSRFSLPPLDLAGAVKKAAAGQGGGLRSFRVSDFPPVGGKPVKALKLDAAVDFTNPSDTAVRLGPVSLSVEFGGVPIATVESRDLAIGAGANELVLSGRVPEATGPALEALSGLVSAFITGSDASITVRGAPATAEAVADSNRRVRLLQAASNTNTTAPQTQVAWVAAALSALELELNVGKASLGDATKQPRKFIESVAMRNLALNFSESDTAGFNPRLSADVDVTYKLPDGFTLSHSVVSVTQTLDLAERTVDAAGNPGTVPVGTLFLPLKVTSTPKPTIPSQTVRTFTARFSDAELQAVGGEVAAFGQFVSDIMYAPGSSTLNMKGQGSVVIDTAVGRLTVDGMKLDFDNTLKHLGSLGRDSVGVTGMQVTGGATEGLAMNASLWVAFKGELSADLGPVQFDLFMALAPDADLLAGATNRDAVLAADDPELIEVKLNNGTALSGLVVKNDQDDTIDSGYLVRVGRVRIPRLALMGGGRNTSMALDVLIFPPFTNVVAAGPRQLLSRYINMAPQTLYLRGGPESSVSPFLQAALPRWRSDVVMGGSAGSILVGAGLAIQGIPLVNMKIMNQLTFRNPFPVAIALEYMDTLIYRQGAPFGRTLVDWRQSPVILEPQRETTTPAYPLQTSINAASIGTLFDGLVNGVAYIKSTGVVQFGIGAYEATIDYVNEQVQVRV